MLTIGFLFGYTGLSWTYLEAMTVESSSRVGKGKTGMDLCFRIMI
jgi:hypothetical protein